MTKIKYLLLIVVIASSCYTQKKAAIQTDKAYSHYPSMVAGKSSIWFPCIVLSSDTLIQTDTLYQLIDIQCPDSTKYIVDSFETSTAVRVPVYIKVKVPYPVEKITIINSKEDSAKILQLTNKLRDAEYDKIISDYKLGKKNTGIKVLAGIAGFFLLALIVLILLITRKYRKP